MPIFIILAAPGGIDVSSLFVELPKKELTTASSVSTGLFFYTFVT